MIPFEDFQKLELCVARVQKAEKIAGVDKLLKLEVDLGFEKRQIVAGIAQFYSAESLIGREIIVVANLEPKIIMGLESQGMLLAANSEQGPVILIPEKEVNPGTKIR